MSGSSRRCTRQRPRLNYCELEEPHWDEYVYCERCYDFVYEYCSVHGALAVVPDDKVPVNHNYPSFVPRAALTVPRMFLHINYSTIPGAGLGIFTTLTLPRGVRFGPYRGRRAVEPDSDYCWQLYDGARKPSHVVDAADPNKSNWMRYVNCARHWREQNLLAYQYQGQIYYRTIKIIPRFTELMVFYGSEYANLLNVDLGRYNAPPGLAQKHGAPAQKKPKVVTKKPQPETTKATDGNKENQHVIKPIECKNKVTPDEVKDKNVPKNEADVKPVEKISENKRPENCNTEININSHTTENKTKLKDKTNTKENSTADLVNVKPKAKNYVRQVDLHDIYFYCDVCKHQSHTKSDLEKHMRFHDLKRKFACDTCGYRFQNYHGLNSHKLHIHKSGTVEKKHECNICEYTTYYLGNLKQHLLVHAGSKPFACNVCQYRCSRLEDLKRHLRIHTGEKPYACNKCSYRCNQAENLKTHQRTHTGEKPYACNKCSYRCNRAGDLKVHQRIHTGEKPYACNKCSYRCNRAGDLKTHQRRHTGEKPYACNKCSYRCNHAGALKVHQRIHTGEKPYACNKCSYRCNHAGNLKTHQKRHTGEKPYACNECKYKATQISNLKTHQRLIHKH